MFNLTKLSLLWEWVNDLKKIVGPSGENLLPSRSTATTGQILKLTGETKTPAWADEYSYTPPDYSTTETATGQKWVDGKDVYRMVITGVIPTLETTATVDIAENLDIIPFQMTLMLYSSGGVYIPARFFLNYSSSTKKLSLTSVSTGFSGNNVIVIIDYTKPDPVPGNREPDQEPEPEEKKTTKKKTSK